MSDKEVQKTTLPPWKSLLAGCAAGAIEGAVTYPFEFAKTMAQFAPDAKKLPLTAVVCIGSALAPAVRRYGDVDACSVRLKLCFFEA
jgi:hypothetical protein